MPSRNTLKLDVPKSYYHIYSRGGSKQPVFLEPVDYTFFVRLFARYLSDKQQFSPFGPYSHLTNKVELLAYCLMPNHFHLLVYQVEEGSMATLMRGVMTSYSRYFNHKYKRTGSLFESRYKASRITSQTYLEHISRYIHINPRYWQRYPYSSMRFYSGKSAPPEWLSIEKVASLFANPQAYFNFVADYEGHKLMLDEIKQELANK